MAILKCKICGGSLVIQNGHTVAECEYCGTKQTVPKVDDERKVSLFTRANHYRFSCEFDKAAGVYETIIADFPDEAEAYWGLILCKYGIEYVDDPATGKKIPTCRRSSFESVMDSIDYDMVIQNADPMALEVYRYEANQIEQLRKSIIEESSKKDPYDIFICYKETDEKGSQTSDSFIAQNVYNALVSKGYKVFFSYVTLKNKLGTEYEPCIFAALNSAKVMLAFGTKVEYYNSVWVKNEWSRFLQLISKGEKKHLIACYKDMDVRDLPKEFVGLQAQDMGRIDAVETLISNIQNILQPSNSAEKMKSTISGEVTVETLLERAYILLHDGDFEKASSYFEKVLDRNPHESRAYWGNLLCKQKCLDNTELTNERMVIYYYSIIKNGRDILTLSDNELIALFRSIWGKNFENACNYASYDEKQIYVACFEKVKNALLEKLHQSQEVLKKELEFKAAEAARVYKLGKEKAVKNKIKRAICSIINIVFLLLSAWILFKFHGISSFLYEGMLNKRINLLIFYVIVALALALVFVIAKIGRTAWVGIIYGIVHGVYLFCISMASTGNWSGNGFGAFIGTCIYFFVGLILLTIYFATLSKEFEKPV